MIEYKVQEYGQQNKEAIEKAADYIRSVTQKQ